MKVAIVTDTWAPDVNGVVRTMAAITAGLTEAGHEPVILSPEQFRTVPCPGYPSIRLAVGAQSALAERIAAVRPDAIHIVTEGPLGIAARSLCLRRRLPFTSAFHTKFPEYLRARAGLPLAWSYAVLRRFHAPSRAVLVAAASIRQELQRRGFSKIVPWSRGVDCTVFRPGLPAAIELPRPVFLYVGRIAIEKNLPGFLDLDLPGSKLVVGDGPLLETMRRRYPQVHFAGARSGEELVRYYAAADAFVLPSVTETYGLVILEALACGIPVAALPVAGPLDVIGNSGTGVLDQDLRAAALAALSVPRGRCRDHATRFGWQASIDQFLGNLAWL